MGLRDAPTILPTFFPFLSLATHHFFFSRPSFALCASRMILRDRTNWAARLKLFPPDCSHPDTLPSVTNHSERAHERSGLAIRTGKVLHALLDPLTESKVIKMHTAKRKNSTDTLLRVSHCNK